MSPPTAVDRPSAQPASPARRGVPTQALLVIASMVVVFALVTLVPSDSFVSRITYVNRSPYDLHVEVATSRDGGWMDAGEAMRSNRTDAGEIFDLGDTWWFRYSAQGRDSRAFRVSRADLERSNWTVRIPDAVARDFQTRAVPVQP